MTFSNIKCLNCKEIPEGETELERVRRRAKMAFHQHVIHYEIMQLQSIAMLLNNTSIALNAAERKLFAEKIVGMINSFQDIIPHNELTEKEYEEFVKIRRREAHRTSDKNRPE